MGQQRAPLRWSEMTAAETAAHPTVVQDILGRRLDGVTVSGVFSPEEAARAVEVLGRYTDERTWAMFGSMLGTPLPEFRGSGGGFEDRLPYYEETERCRAIYREAFGYNPEQRVREAVAPMAGGLAVETPAERGRSYNPGNVRWYEPGAGGLPAHVGNEFHMHDDTSMAHLRTTTATRDFLSWFVVLQVPDAGGALSVYDRVFESHRPTDENWTDRGRDDSDFDGLPALSIAPEPGGMAFFGGGWRWHRVDEVVGARPRITYGGFAGPSLDGRSLHLWF